MGLKFKKPTEVQKRLKLMLWGGPGVGKTTCAIQFPKSAYIGTERGAEHAQYTRKLIASGSQIIETTDYDEIIGQLTALASEKHDFHTVIIDPITTIETDLIQKGEKLFGAGDMRVWGYRDKSMKRLCSRLLNLDMNCVIIVHGGTEYGEGMKKIGTKPEGWKKLEFLVDLSLEIRRNATDPKLRDAVVRKSRIETFPDGDVFAFSYESIAKRYGADTLERQATPVVMANADQVSEFKRLLDTVKMEDGWLEKALAKYGVDEIQDLTGEQIERGIKALKDKAGVK